MRSLDVNQVILQTNAVERVQQVQQQHPDVQQRYFKDQLRKEEKELKEKVKDTRNTENPVIDEKDRRNRQEGRSEGEKGQKSKEDADNKDQMFLADECGGTVDIKV